MESYTLIKHLGSGSSGKWYLVSSNTGEKHVIKQIDITQLKEKERSDAVREGKILQALYHPNIISCHEVYRTETGKLNIVMEYADGGDLRSKILSQKGKFFSEQQVLSWFVQIALGLKHIHDRKVMHRDIKSQNVFLTAEGLIKVGDFGMSKMLSSTSSFSQTCLGTPYYMSPEIVQGLAHNQKSDIWALGVLLYELWAQKPPFDSPSLIGLGQSIVTGRIPPLPKGFSMPMRRLVSKLLSTDPEKRPDIAEVLKLPFVCQHIQGFLSSSVMLDEFSHTVLHNQNLFEAAQAAQNALKVAPPEPIPEEDPRPPTVETEAERLQVVEEIRARRREIFDSPKRTPQQEEQAMIYDMQEALLANSPEKVPMNYANSEDDIRGWDTLGNESIKTPHQALQENIEAIVGCSAYNEAMSIVVNLGVHETDTRQYYGFFDHVIPRELQDEIIPNLWAIAKSELV